MLDLWTKRKDTNSIGLLADISILGPREEYFFTSGAVPWDGHG